MLEELPYRIEWVSLRETLTQQADICDFKASLVEARSSRLTKAT